MGASEMWRTSTVLCGLALVGGGLLPTAEPASSLVADAGSQAAMPFDFDGDGHGDLAVGIPGEDLRGVPDAGALQVLYGSERGVSARDQLWHQGRKGIKGKLEPGDAFGVSRASGDFDGDGFADLAVGIPHEDVGTIRDAGAVQVLYGGSRGLTRRDQVWHQDKRGVPGSNQESDDFGKAVAAGDFDADGFDDLAIGIPGKAQMSGAVVVLRGSDHGLTSANAMWLAQGSGGIPGRPSMGEQFGFDLAAGDVTGDGRSDLIIAANDRVDPADSGSGVTYGDTLAMLPGSPGGLSTASGQYFGMQALGLSPHLRVDAMALSDLNGDGTADLTMYAAGWGDGTYGPEVVVIHGHPDGFHPEPLNPPGTPGVDAHWSIPDEWHFSLERVAAGDFTGDGNPDVAFMRQGGLGVILGGPEGLGTSIHSWLGFATPHMTLAVLDVEGPGHGWLIVGSVGSTDPHIGGAVTVMRGTASGEPGETHVWHQDVPGVKGVVEQDDQFGIVAGRPPDYLQ